MSWQWSPSVIAEVTAAAGLLLIAIYFPWRNLNRRASFFGASLLLACALWVLSHAMEIGLPLPSYKSYLMGAQLIWGIIALTFWLLYIVHHTGPKKWMTTRAYALFGIMPLIGIVGVCTNHVHSLIWSNPGLDGHNPYLPLQPTYGLIYWICMAYLVVLILSGSLLLISNVVRLHHGRNKESAGLLIAAVLPMLAALIETLGLSGSLKLSIGITPWVSLIGAVILVWNLPRFHLHDVLPYARDTIFERIEDYIIVLDDWDRILDLNPASERFFGHRISDVLGFSVKQILPQWPDRVGKAGGSIGSAREIVLERGGVQRTYNLSVSAASDPAGHSPSKVVLLADITYRKKVEEERLQSAEQLLNALKATIESISRTSEIRDPYTGGHQKRVAQPSFPRKSCLSPAN
ncbi:MAG: PAS domain S-box protein [Candidatus Aminicenantes bacterium]|nr:PAS domain S-box protein [Candidatus Aminicenantes bacterium]